MRVSLIIVFFTAFISCQQNKICKNVVMPITTGKVVITNNYFDYRNGNYQLLDSITTFDYGIIRIVRPIATDDDFRLSDNGREVNDSIFLFYTLDSKPVKLFLTDVGFFNATGKIQAGLFSNTLSSRILITLEIDYHSGLGGYAAYIETWWQTQKMIIDLSHKRILFDCKPIDGNWVTEGIDSTKNKWENTIWKKDSSIYGYNFHFLDKYLLLDSLSGNKKPDKEMGIYIMINDKYEKQK
ncbi:MAG: hypothetical protein WCK02_18080 [Bacteroidota bacterium]